MRIRREQETAFGDKGDYTPLVASGTKRHHVVAFIRGETVAVIVPRLPVTLGGDWQDTRVHLPEGSWRNALSDSIVPGGEMDLGTVLKPFPVALLVKQ
ncbi:MAG: hypothetical protein JOZ62_14350 [Acidobacteriaceae bacterium]|nr:hypothetical protein [Acidobacteriaceae bacterium]